MGGTCLEAMEAALELEKTVNESLLELAKVADAKGDAHLTDFVDEFLDEQVASIKRVGDTLASSSLQGDGCLSLWPPCRLLHHHHPNNNQQHHLEIFLLTRRWLLESRTELSSA